MWPWSQRQSRTCKNPYTAHTESSSVISWAGVFIFRRMIAYGYWHVVCLSWSFYPSQYFFSHVMSGWLLLGWTGTKQDLMFLACHIFFLQSCGHLLGMGWPLGSLVCDVFLCLYHLPTLCPGSCVELDCIDSWPLPSYLLCSRTICSSTCDAQTPATPLSRLKHSSTGYCTRIICGDSDESFCYDLGVKGLRQYISYKCWREFFFYFQFARGCPYIAKWFLKAGTLKWRFQRTNMTLRSNVNVFRIGPTARNMNFCSLW